MGTAAGADELGISFFGGALVSWCLNFSLKIPLAKKCQHLNLVKSRFPLVKLVPSDDHRRAGHDGKNLEGQESEGAHFNSNEEVVVLLRPRVHSSLSHPGRWGCLNPTALGIWWRGSGWGGRVEIERWCRIGADAGTM